VEQFVRDGFSYRLARRPIRDGGVERLTKREQEALECALDGLSNKTIAYALGLAPSTVGVLLFRAAAKLGVKSRRDLLLAYSQIKSENESR
jgi:DNA-binding CsgD family transcriptional regulator